MSVLYENNFSSNLELIKEIAEQTFPDRPVLRDLGITQAILESRLTGIPSQLALKYRNLFGMKPGLTKSGTAVPGVVYLMTTEYIPGGGKERTKAPFLSNKNIEDSFEQYKKLIGLDRYARVRAAKSFDQAAFEIRAGGYASDPLYTKLLIETYNKYVKNLETD